jgi:uncharacterized protein (DUF697 family)
MINGYLVRTLFRQSYRAAWPWEWWQNVVPKEQTKPEDLVDNAPIPVIWLFGRTGSGKTSIIRYLTGALEAEIGQGFRPQTRQSRRFDFPDDQLPLVSFLDTRGLGEADYDPREDLAEFDEQAHLMLVTVRATDHACEEVLEPLKKIRRANSHRPILLVVTALHDAYPGKQHVSSAELAELTDEQLETSPRLDENLRRALAAQRERWKEVADKMVAIDLTPPEEDFDEPEWGGDRLKRAILELLPAAYRHTLLEMDKVSGALRGSHDRRANRLILAHSAFAASAAAVPVPWVDIPVVMGVQSYLAHRLAELNGQTLDPTALAYVTSSLGGRLAARLGLRSLLKAIPVVGIAANAAAAFAFTYASGWAWNYYFVQVRGGHVPSAEQLREVYQAQLKRGRQLWQATDRPTESP